MINKVFNKKQVAVHKDTVLQSDFSKKVIEREVVLMAIHGNYAMVKVPRCMPYVCVVKDLVIIN